MCVPGIMRVLKERAVHGFLHACCTASPHHPASLTNMLRHPRFTIYREAPRLPRRKTSCITRAMTSLFSEERKPLVVVGSINADLVCEVDRIPAPGETLAADSLNVYPGGKVGKNHHLWCCARWVGLEGLFASYFLQGANQAAAAAKLEYPTYFVGQVRSSRSSGLATYTSIIGARISLLNHNQAA